MCPFTFTEVNAMCDKVRPEDFNTIQDYGALLALNHQLQITHYSSNLPDFLHIAIDTLLSQPITHFLKAADINQDLKQALNSADYYKRLLWIDNYLKIPLYVVTHPTANGVVLEIEIDQESVKATHNDVDILQRYRFHADPSEHEHALHHFLQLACDEVKRLTNFNRVIAYRFDPVDATGIIIGEASNSDMELYLGLHFPATDIPLLIRQMFLKLPFRYIPNTDCKNYDIINVGEQPPVDLSATNLRGCAPVHVQYMHMMSLSASTSIPIIYNQKLWGLVVGHHTTAKRLSVSIRNVLIAVGKMLSDKITLIEEMKTAQQLEALNKVKITFSNVDMSHYPHEMMTLLNAQGLTLKTPQQLANYGDTPNSSQISQLLAWIKKSHGRQNVFSTASLPLTYEESAEYKNVACGLLCMKLPTLNDAYLIFYRKESIQKVEWGGNPYSQMNITANQYAPRQSFERWLETVTDFSLPWTEHDLNIAEFIRTQVVNSLSVNAATRLS